MRRAALLWVAVTATSIVSGCSNSEGRKGPPAAQTGGGTGVVGAGGAGATLKDDGEFVRDVAIKNMAAVELSRLALEKASRADIKSFAQTIIDEDGAAGERLRSVASGQSTEWPAQLDEKHRDAADELADEQGADFDREYVKAMIESHQDLAAKLETRLDVQSLADWKTAAAGRSRTGALPDPPATLRDVPIRPDRSGGESSLKISQWAAETYPTAQKHLDTARTLENAANKGSND
jgi:putative membrane protein